MGAISIFDLQFVVFAFQFYVPNYVNGSKSEPCDQCKQVWWTSEIAAFIGKIIICDLRRLFGLKLMFLRVLNFVIRLERCFQCVQKNHPKWVSRKKENTKFLREGFDIIYSFKY